MQEDQDIVKDVLGGDKQAFAFVIDKYKGQILALLRKMLGPSPDLQDIAQEVFIQAYNHLKEYKAEHSFSAWIYRIASNRCIDELRKRKRTPIAVSFEFEAAHCETPEASYLEKERNSALEKLIWELDPDHRVVFILRHQQYLSYQEIAEQLSLPVSTVQMRLYRARLKLRKSLVTSGEKGGSLYELYEG
ncbi:RNA polymerase sigma factor [Paenibacillus thalictri]|uniref:Sigma-70 family RNA polymerase sigma factor n=1 Tax=Paenibacillus thalictri TaxID=2527873 RepID=A0A4Q9DKG1_9BACL|nr:sigma-70 family RNA polymerase sigma factor [Paenibacillus thalictri]TBL72652.1 sigma-70 family RNA polymerase sigma factor [Paenibacillus thalictri]